MEQRTRAAAMNAVQTVTLAGDCQNRAAFALRGVEAPAHSEASGDFILEVALQCGNLRSLCTGASENSTHE